jgi:hypothetical protein
VPEKFRQLSQPKPIQLSVNMKDKYLYFNFELDSQATWLFLQSVSMRTHQARGQFMFAAIKIHETRVEQ